MSKIPCLDNSQSKVGAAKRLINNQITFVPKYKHNYFRKPNLKRIYTENKKCIYPQTICQGITTVVCLVL